MSRTYGRVWLGPGCEGDEQWNIKAEPHLILRIKRIFARVSKGQHGTVKIHDNDEVRRDLLWFLGRYSLTISDADKRHLRKGAKRHKDTILRLEQLVDLNYSAPGFKLAIPARDYQKAAAAMYLTQGFLLLADEVGIGKTVASICSLTNKATLPALVVTLSGTVPEQCRAELERFAPALNVHVAQKGTSYPLPKLMGKGPDVIVMNYHKLSGWADTLAGWVRSVIFDEIQELRRSVSQKYAAANRIAGLAKFRIGLSATPIYNYGGEIFNVMDVLQPGLLGTVGEFTNEWCSSHGRHSTLSDPKAFGTYMREHFYILRRTRKAVGRELPPLSKITQKVEYDRKALDDVEESARALAEMILNQEETRRGELLEASNQLSWTLRQATGVGKAPHVADFIRLLAESGEKVMVYAWHRTVYDILQSKLKDLKPVMFTGSETPAKKHASKKAFMGKDSNIMLISLRAGAGIDGLQRVCRTVVFGELDWSPGIHEQCTGRIFRDGQPDPVTAYFMLSDGGSDPVIAERLGLKSEQVDGIRDPDLDLLEKLNSNAGRAKALARHYLASLRKRKRKRPLARALVTAVSK